MGVHLLRNEIHHLPQEGLKELELTVESFNVTVIPSVVTVLCFASHYVLSLLFPQNCLTFST